MDWLNGLDKFWKTAGIKSGRCVRNFALNTLRYWGLIEENDGVRWGGIGATKDCIKNALNSSRTQRQN